MEHIDNFKRILRTVHGVKEIEPIEYVYKVETEKGTFRLTFNAYTGKLLKQESVLTVEKRTRLRVRK